MRRLLLVRHAKSSWAYPSLEDHERPLNRRGKRDVPLMVSRLLNRENHLDTVFSSSAVRAVAIAEKLAEAFDSELIIAPALYTFSSASFLNFLHQLPDTHHCIALVGHNPAITSVAEWLANTRIDNIPTAGVAAFCTDVSAWSELHPDNCHMDYFEYPKK